MAIILNIEDDDDSITSREMFEDVHYDDLNSFYNYLIAKEQGSDLKFGYKH